jgi:hypothetical protein
LWAWIASGFLGYVGRNVHQFRNWQGLNRKFREWSEQDLAKICAIPQDEKKQASEINKQIKGYKDLYIKKLIPVTNESAMASKEFY